MRQEGCAAEVWEVLVVDGRGQDTGRRVWMPVCGCGWSADALTQRDVASGVAQAHVQQVAARTRRKEASP